MLGQFSPLTTLAQNTVATALGTAPFALLLAFVPVTAPSLQALLLDGSAVLFVAYAAWVLRRRGA